MDLNKEEKFHDFIRAVFYSFEQGDKVDELKDKMYTAMNTITEQQTLFTKPVWQKGCKCRVTSLFRVVECPCICKHDDSCENKLCEHHQDYSKYFAALKLYNMQQQIYVDSRQKLSDSWKEFRRS